MYLKSIFLENTGPIDQLDLTLPFAEEENPKPVIFVGENGTGKSLILAYIVNCLLWGKQLVFRDSDVEKGHLYKYCSPNWIKNDRHYSYANLIFEDNHEFVEWVLDTVFKYAKNNNKFNKLFEHHHSHLWPLDNEDSRSLMVLMDTSSAKKQVLKEGFEGNITLFFPPNRFEQPSWLNYNDLKIKAELTQHQNIEGYSNRKIIQFEIISEIQNWFFDIIFDTFMNFNHFSQASANYYYTLEDWTV